MMNKRLQKEHKRGSPFNAWGKPIFVVLLCCLTIAQAAGETLSSLATLFCENERKDRQGNCIYFDEDPGTLREATVVVISNASVCSGSIIELQRGHETCKTPFLLTAGHCADPTKTGNTISFANRKIQKSLGSFYKVKNQTLKSLQTKCVRSQDHPTQENCLLTPQHILNDDKKLDFGGVDQALIPITNYGSNLPRIRVDLNSLLKKDELTQCFNKKHEATVVSYLTEEHLSKIGKGHLNTGEDKDHIRADRCSDLSWLTKTKSNIKSLIGHRCPTLKGMSGSFFSLSCGNKQALFVYQGQSFKGASDSLKQRAKAGENILPSEYQVKEGFKNTATHIDSKLLELYAKDYCGFSPLGS